MMERRRVLTIPFCVEKDHQSETPLKIPINCLSPECRKLERQIPWTAFADCKKKSNNSQHKNGSMIFDRSPAAVITVEMTRRKPILILKDVLKTELGKDYIERVKMSGTICLRGRPKGSSKEMDCFRQELQTCRNTRSTQREANNNTRSESLTPKRDVKTTSSSLQRKRLKRKLQNDEDEHEEKSQDTEEIIRGKEDKKDEKFDQVLDCELLPSLRPTAHGTSCDECPSDSIKDRVTSPKKDEQQKRKSRIHGSWCNGTSGSKRRCQSVDDGKEGGQVSSSGEEEQDGNEAATSVNMEESEEDVDLENMDRCILQFTVGGKDGTEALVPVITPLLEAEDKINIQRQKSLSKKDSMTQTSPSEPIVLSSDDEEGSGSSQGSREVTQTVAETVRQEKSSQKDVSKQEEASDTQMLELLVEESLPSVPASPVPEVDYSCLSVPFSLLVCGGYKARTNGSLMIAEHKILIPLKDTNMQERMLSFERKELRKYSIWDQQELEEWQFQFDGEEASSGVLLFYVSETAAAAVHQDLCQLCVKDEESINTEKACPFILLTLRYPLEGMEGALLRSMLDIDCINSMTLEQTILAQDDRIGISSPVLSMDDSLELIRRTGLDSHLLSMLSVRSTTSKQRTDQDSSNYDEDEIPTAHIWLDADFQSEPDLEQDTGAEEDTETQIKPKEDPKEENLENSSDNIKEEAQPVYTVCHRRTKGSYSVSLSKPDSKWIKYKHRGVARRLIQFPPPPLKGGITVTLEDLQCLDSGQYLNDVIIDFYLKYLIQNAPAAIAERCHIFSSFFYKQLTRRDNASEGGNNDSCQRQRRHQRVKTWTRHVDIFEKDFLFVPVNQESHWYLVVICFPGLEELKLEDWAGDTEDQDEAQECKSSKDTTETPVALKHSDSPDPETEKNREESTKSSKPCPVCCTERTCQKKTLWKRPCILIMDSLKISQHERVFKLLREYLQSEWEARRGSERDFGPDQMKSSHCKVPLQDNSSDCGLYLLQYVECFLKDPVVHFDLPLHLQQWFPRQLVRKKRDEIRDLILNLYRHQNLEND